MNGDDKVTMRFRVSSGWTWWCYISLMYLCHQWRVLVSQFETESWMPLANKTMGTRSCSFLVNRRPATCNITATDWGHRCKDDGIPLSMYHWSIESRKQCEQGMFGYGPNHIIIDWVGQKRKQLGLSELKVQWKVRLGTVITIILLSSWRY